jgi:hypothetical protein
VNECVTKFTQLSRYALHDVDTNEKKQECFLNGLNDGLAYTLEAQDFENFQGMVHKAPVLENRRGVMEQKHKLVRQHQQGSCSRLHVTMSSAGPMFCPTHRSFSQGRRQLDKDSPPRSVKWFSTQTISRLLVLGIRVFKGLKLLRTHYKVNKTAMLVGSEVTLPANAPIHTPTLLRQLCLPLHPLLPSKTTSVGRSIMSRWRKPRKLQTWSLVYFLSMTLLQLCCLILEHHILSYLLHMLRSIICL